MADITAADVTYNVFGSVSIGPGRIARYLNVTFPGDGARLDYPAGGVPLDPGKMGFPRGISTIRVIGRTLVVGEANPIWLWNGSTTAPKLLGFEQKTAAKQSAEMTTAGNDKALILATPQVIMLEVEG